MQVFAFLFCDCIHESGYGTVSLHATKRAAYKAMRKYVMKMAMDARDHALADGLVRRRGIDKPFAYQRWTVEAMMIEADESIDEIAIQPFGPMDVVITSNRHGEVVLISLQDDHQITNVLWESQAPYGAHEHAKPAVLQPC